MVRKAKRRRYIFSTVGILFSTSGCLRLSTSESSSPDSANSDPSQTLDYGEQGRPHELPHTNDDEVPESEIEASTIGGVTEDGISVAKEEAKYQHHPKDQGNKRCGNCKYYKLDSSGDGYGACSNVNGKIHPCDTCLHWSPYSGSNPVPCEKSNELFDLTIESGGGSSLGVIPKGGPTYVSPGQNVEFLFKCHNSFYKNISWSLQTDTELENPNWQITKTDKNNQHLSQKSYSSPQIDITINKENPVFDLLIELGGKLPEREYIYQTSILIARFTEKRTDADTRMIDSWKTL